MELIAVRAVFDSASGHVINTLKSLSRYAPGCLAALIALNSSTVKGGGERYVLYTEQLPPYSIDQEGGAAGLSVDIVSALFSRVELPFEIQIVPWKRAYAVARNSAQACIFPIQRTQEREASFHWFSPITITQTGFYTLENSVHQIRTLGDVSGLKIGTYRGSAVAEYLSRLGYDVDMSASEATNLDRLRYQRIQVWAADTLTAKYLAEQARVDRLDEQLVFYTSLRSLACNLAMPSSVVETLKSELKAMHQDGSIDQLVEKYY